MTTLIIVLLGLALAITVCGIALGIVAYARDHCDETLPSTPANKKKSQPRDAHGRFVKKK